ncbi:MAG: hypothetical protein ACRC0X_03180 [Brevinema sp.]
MAKRFKDLHELREWLQEEETQSVIDFLKDGEKQINNFRDWLVSNYDKINSLNTLDELVDYKEWFEEEDENNISNFEKFQQIKDLDQLLELQNWFDNTDTNGNKGYDKIQKLYDLETVDLDEIETSFTQHKQQLDDDFEELQSSYQKYESALEQGYKYAQSIIQVYTDNDAKLAQQEQVWEILKKKVTDESTKWKTEYQTELEKARQNVKAEFTQFEKDCQTTRKKIDSIMEELQQIKDDSYAILGIATSAKLATSYGSKIIGLQESIKQQKDKFFWINISVSIISLLFLVFNIVGIICKWFELADYQSFISRFFMVGSVIVPLIWIAKQSGELMRQDMHILEEYEHKKALVSTYVGYKDDLLSMIKNQEGIEQKQHIIDLIQSTTQGIMKNPANTLPRRKHEKLPLEDAITTVLDASKALKTPLNILEGVVKKDS